MRSYAQLRATFAAYQTVSERTLIEAIEAECSGSLKDGYLAIGKLIEDTDDILSCDFTEKSGVVV